MPARKPKPDPPPLEELALSDAIQADRAETWRYLAPGATAFEPLPIPPDQNAPAEGLERTRKQLADAQKRIRALEKKLAKGTKA
jgi:hypothetical protein